MKRSAAKDFTTDGLSPRHEHSGSVGQSCGCLVSHCRCSGRQITPGERASSSHAQNLIEFRNVATRPKAANGLGLTVSEAESKAVIFEASFSLLAETADI